MDCTHDEMVKTVEFKTDQTDLIGVGIIVKKDQDGTEFKIGDMVTLTEPEFRTGNINNDMITIHPPTDITGILTLVLDQGVCLISDKYWIQISRSKIQKWKWELLSFWSDKNEK